MRIILLTVCLLFLVLAPSNAQNEQNQYQTSKGDLHLLGAISVEQLKEAPFSEWYNLVYEGYSVDKAALARLNKYYDEGISVKIYPESGNTFDSLGEAYLKIGDSVLATTNYLKSLQLDATNENATKVLLAMLADKESR